ncbi:MAG: hypothetical protein KAS66_03965 [Candidatus Omnitrophica bacterium]|nr:hypothetical protein [Candidatus Omnitrophota bacterium]
MRKLIILTAVTSVLLLSTQQQAWAGNKTHRDNDDYRAFKKIVRVLNAVINDGHRRRGNYVYVETYYPRRRVCYYRGHRKVCNLRRHGHRRRRHDHYYKEYPRRGRYDRDGYHGRHDYR